jgi:hypothetical protein
MPAASLSRSTPEHRISAKVLRRAERAFCCSGLQIPLFVAMQVESVPLSQVSGLAGLQNSYTRRSIAEWVVEDRLMWLIQVGALRREVDGQGITDSFRLTPLGQMVVDRWRHHGKFPQASPWDHFYNAWHRWMRLPI